MADRPGLERDATGRRLAFLPAAVLGNGELLVTLSARGELERLFWPHVDRGRHGGELRLGLDRGGRVEWLDEEPFAWRQRYEPDALVLATMVEGTGVVVEDVVAPDEPTLVRRVRGAPDARLVVEARPELDGGVRHVAAWVEGAATVFYRRDVALALELRGADARAEVRDREGRGAMAHRPPVRATLGAAIRDGAELVIAFGRSPEEALERARAAPAWDDVAAARRAADTLRLERAGEPLLDGEHVRALHRRSVLVLAALCDRATGAVVAAPECDDDFLHSGGYGFVWARDLAFCALGLLAAGAGDLAAAALRWLVRAQSPDGSWLHRHWSDGSLAPSWGLRQIDETGLAVFTFERAWRALRDPDLDAELWPAARRAAEHLLDEVGADGLPRPSFDLWEQAEGRHAYSAAAVAGGLDAAAAFAERHEPARAAAYRAGAERVRAALDAELWSESDGRYLRARFDDGDLEEARLDSALLGLSWPFAAAPPGGERMRATVLAVERGLAAPGGGLLRHAGDTYAGGNEWLLASLWLALHRRQLGDETGWRRLVEHVAARRTGLDLLPEQVTEDGRPAWVLPLAWSHAFFVLAVRPEVGGP